MCKRMHICVFVGLQFHERKKQDHAGNPCQLTVAINNVNWHGSVDTVAIDTLAINTVSIATMGIDTVAMDILATDILLIATVNWQGLLAWFSWMGLGRRRAFSNKYGNEWKWTSSWDHMELFTKQTIFFFSFRLFVFVYSETIGLSLWRVRMTSIQTLRWSLVKI